jgi:hypothetical protein
MWIAQVATVDTLAEILAIGNTTGATDIAVDSAQKVQFRDAAIYINSSVDGQLDIVADTEIQIAATTIDVNGALDVSGTALVTGVLTTTAATVSNGGGQFNGAINVGVDDTGYDVKFFGATTGKSLLWDESADSLIVTGTTTLVGTTNLDAVDIDGATQIDATVTVGVDDTGYDVKFFGATAGAYMLWDESADDLILGGAAGLSVNSTALVTGVLTTTAATVHTGGITMPDNAKAIFGDSSDLEIYHDGTQSFISEQGPSSLNILSSQVALNNPANTENMLLAVESGAVTLFHNNAAKLATTATGINVTGTVVAAAGTALLPSITTTGDLNTGMWFPAADTIAFSEGGVEALRIDSSGNVGIGTSSPAARLDIRGSGAQNIYLISTSATNQTNALASLYNNGGGYGDLKLSGLNLLFHSGTSATESMRIDSSGNVGIGTSSPSYKLHVRGADATAVLVVGNTSEDTRLEVLTYQDDRAVLRANDTSNTARTLAFETGTTERMRIDASGNVGIGMTPVASYGLLQVGSAVTSALGVGGLQAYVAGTNSALGQNGNMSIVTTDGQAENIGGSIGLGGKFVAAGTSVLFAQISGRKENGTDNNSAGYLQFATQPNGGTPLERMRIDSSGNVLVGMTTANTGNNGVGLRADGLIHAKRANIVANFNRQTSEGVVVELAKDNTVKGRIGVQGDSLWISSAASMGIYIWDAGALLSCDTAGNADDNLRDIGHASYRWRTIFAGTGSINTSDRTEKQDIDVMSEAETRVAVACKGLMRKFRFIDAVEAKGDDARIHFGIIAQDLQDAFAAEGLDASRYAMFCSDTWWEADRVVPAVEAVDATLDDEGNQITEAVVAVAEHTVTDKFMTLEKAPEGATERTRLGVRYSELLAFIIGAL